jgi:putative thioredoxin
MPDAALICIRIFQIHRHVRPEIGLPTVMDVRWTIMDVTTADFETKVIQQSQSKPVVVDFWAPWCGPCRTLTPTLEGLEAEYAGKFVLAKVNTDAEPSLGQAFKIMSIPDVKIFQNGKVVGGFVGAQPANAIREILDQFIPSEDFLKITNLVANDPVAALDLLEASSVSPRKREELAWAITQQLLQKTPLPREKITTVVGMIPEFGSPHSDARSAILYFLEALISDKDLQDLTSAKSESAARLLDEKIEAIENNQEKEANKEFMVRAFHVLGNDNPLTTEYRKKLSRALF